MSEEFFVGVNELDVNRIKAEIKKGPDDRSRDVATEVARGEISKLVQQGKEIGGWLMAGETIQTGAYLLGEKELLSEDVVEMLVEKKPFMERLEIMDMEESSRAK